MRTIVCISILLAAGCNSATKPRFNEIPESGTISIAGLKALCNGLPSVNITRNAYIRGQVVANDLFGEFYREIVIQDDSGGIAIALEGEALADKFPFGALVEVSCHGLTLSEYGGKVGLGTEPDETGKGEIPADEIDRYIQVSTETEAAPRANVISLAEVGQEVVDTRVRFEGVRFIEPGATWCDVDPDTGRIVSTEREIEDSQGNRFRVRTLWSCDYANEILPEGVGSLTGVIDYFGGKYSLRVTFREKEFSGEMGPGLRYEGGGFGEDAENKEEKDAGAESG